MIQLTEKVQPNMTQQHLMNPTVFQTVDFNLWYGEHHALKSINLDVKENEVTAIIGPSGCGKSTYIKALNRMVELVPIVRTSGEIQYRKRNIFDTNYESEESMCHYMINNKTEVAWKIFYSNKKITYPEYINNAIEELKANE